MTDPTPPQPPADDRQWIPVAPSHPSGVEGASGGAGAGSGRPAGGASAKAFVIVAMAMGLIALLTVIVATLYLERFPLLLGAVLGVLAIALGIVGLVQRGRPLAAGIVGIATGALSGLLAAVMMIAFAVLTNPAQVEIVPVDPDSRSQQQNEPEQSLIEWPANMASGGVVFERGEGSTPAVRASAPVAPGESPAPSVVDREGEVADILLYVDFRCPHCMSFDEANGALLSELVTSGQATLEIVPVSFVDRTYSAALAGAFACVVDGQPAVAWSAYTALFSAEVQVNDPTVEVLLAALEPATGGLDPAVRDCIETAQFAPFMEALSAWVFSNTVPNALDASLQVRGTPTALVNGMPYAGDPSDAAAFAHFVAEQLG